MKHAFIAPVNYLDLIPDSCDFHLCLAHLLHNERYRSFYKEKIRRGDFVILDNGAYEYKRPMLIEEVVGLCKEYDFRPNVLVLPDYPFESGSKTIQAAVSSLKFIQSQKLIDWPCQFMAVPQSEVGAVGDWLNCYKTLSENPLISWIGLSILGVPNAFQSLTETKDVSFNRSFAISFLKQNRSFSQRVSHHCLGCDSPREIAMMTTQEGIVSNDSSTAFWHGIQGIRFDDTATGLRKGKSLKEVDFFIDRDENVVGTIQENVAWIERFL